MQRVAARLPRATRGLATTREWSTLSAVAEPALPAPTDATVDRTAAGMSATPSILSRKWARFEGMVPLWVADSDFRTPAVLSEALVDVARSGIYGYTDPSKATITAVAQKLDTTHGFGVPGGTAVEEQQESVTCSLLTEREQRFISRLTCVDANRQLRWLPGLVPGIHHTVRAVQALKREAEIEVASVTPIYYPFLITPGAVGAKLLEIPLSVRQGDTPHTMEHALDLDKLESTLARPECKVMLWCNPHNPSGRVWNREELAAVAQLCVKHDVVLLSDEVWADLVLDDERTPFLGMAALIPDIEGLAERLIVISSPSKTYNVACVDVAFAAIPDASLRRAFTRAGRDKAETTPFGFAAVHTAYTNPACSEWRDRLKTYLRANRDHIEAVLTAHVSPDQLRLTRPDASYLTWMDVSGLRLGSSAGLFFQSHGVALTDGAPFRGSSCVRLNFATSRATLNAGLECMLRAFDAAATSA